MIRKRFYFPVILILLLMLFVSVTQTGDEKSNDYTKLLNGVSEEYYETRLQINGDGLLLMKVNQVGRNDFQNFVNHYGMTQINNTYDIMSFSFENDQEWWPHRNDFKKGKKFYFKADRSEFFACLIDDVCYISHRTW
jgi:hypothetical protein